MKEEKDKAMSLLSSYEMAISRDVTHEDNMSPQLVNDTVYPPFISLLDLVSEIYQVLPQKLLPVY